MCLPKPKIAAVQPQAPTPPPASPTVTEIDSPDGKKTAASLRRGLAALRIQRPAVAGIPNPSPSPYSGLAIG